MDFLERTIVRRITASATAIALMAAIGVGGVAAGGPPAPAFYVDGAVFRTVGTPTDLSGTGAPSSTYDVIYALGFGLMNVAESKPGDTDYNGGRWIVLAVTWGDGVTPVQLTSDTEVLAAASGGLLTIGTTPVKQFVCPVIPLRG